MIVGRIEHVDDLKGRITVRYENGGHSMIKIPDGPFPSVGWVYTLSRATGLQRCWSPAEWAAQNGKPLPPVGGQP